MKLCSNFFIDLSANWTQWFEIGLLNIQNGFFAVEATRLNNKKISKFSFRKEFSEENNLLNKVFYICWMKVLEDVQIIKLKTKNSEFFQNYRKRHS